MKFAAALLLALLAAGPVRAEVIKTDTSGIDTGDAKIKVADASAVDALMDQAAYDAYLTTL